MKTNCFSKQTNKENHKLTHKYRYIMKKKSAYLIISRAPHTTNKVQSMHFYCS